jgi:O-antigen/teichoic acid export membrane protein
VVGRIIGPTAFGLAAAAYLFGSLAEIFVATPFVDPLIQRRRLDRSVVDAAFTAMVAAGIVVYLLILAAAPVLAMIYDSPSLVGLVAAQGTTCLFLGVRGVPEAILARKMRFTLISVRSIVAKIASALVSVIAALLGMGAWSIILGNVSFAAGSTVMVLLVTRRMPRLAYLPEQMASLLSFGLFSLLDGVLWTATSRLYGFLVGYFQGLQALGELNIAFRINDTACSLIGAAATRLALPMFSRVANDRWRLEQAFLSGTRVVCLLVAPLFLGLIATSREIIEVALGPEWHLASDALIAVCIFSLMNFSRVLALPTVKAVAQPALLIRPNVIGLLYIAAGSLLLRHAGFDAVLSVWSSFGIVYVLCSLRMVQVAIGTDWLTQLKPLAASAGPALGMCAVLYVVAALHPAIGTLAMLAVKIAAGGLTYVSLLVLLERPLLVQILGLPQAAGGPGGLAR